MNRTRHQFHLCLLQCKRQMQPPLFLVQLLCEMWCINSNQMREGFPDHKYTHCLVNNDGYVSKTEPRQGQRCHSKGAAFAGLVSNKVTGCQQGIPRWFLKGSLRLCSRGSYDFAARASCTVVVLFRPAIADWGFCDKQRIEGILFRTMIWLIIIMSSAKEMTWLQAAAMRHSFPRCTETASDWLANHFFCSNANNVWVLYINYLSPLSADVKPFISEDNNL